MDGKTSLRNNMSLKQYFNKENDNTLKRCHWIEFYLKLIKMTIEWIVCVEVLRPSQPNGVMSSAFSLPNHTFTGQA